MSITDQVNQIVALIWSWLTEKKVGNIQINFFKGGISSVNFNETVKLGEGK